VDFSFEDRLLAKIGRVDAGKHPRVLPGTRARPRAYGDLIRPAVARLPASHVGVEPSRQAARARPPGPPRSSTAGGAPPDAAREARRGFRWIQVHGGPGVERPPLVARSCRRAVPGHPARRGGIFGPWDGPKLTTVRPGVLWVTQRMDGVPREPAASGGGAAGGIPFPLRRPDSSALVGLGDYRPGKAIAKLAAAGLGMRVDRPSTRSGSSLTRRRPRLPGRKGAPRRTRGRAELSWALTLPLER